jgi:gliding motility-associated protein GldE
LEEVPVNFLLLIFSGIELHLLNTDALLSLFSVLLLLVLSAFISASEVGYFSLTSAELEEMDNDNVRNLMQNPNELLATILIVNNFINVGIVVISAYLTSITISFPEGSSLEFIFQILIITSLLLLFGEIMPKVYANNNAVRFSLSMSKVLVFLKKAVYPLSYLLVTSLNFIDKKLASKQIEISIEEISKALDITEHESKEEERRILRSIVEFGNTDVKEIMKSRVNISAIDTNTSFTDVLKIIISSGYSRIPVFDGQIDKVVGILYIKDLIPHLNQNDNFDWVQLYRAPYFVPETKMINDLLKDFQSQKNHLAIVVDEYGGTSGLVTLEDVLEEIVGEINDEFDVDDNIYSKLDDRNYIFDGKISLNDFLKITKGEIDFFDEIKGDSDTLAGLVLELEGSIPKIGTTCKVPPFTIVVESADLRKIKRLKVTIDEN